jgi:hypothetical protein
MNIPLTSASLFQLIIQVACFEQYTVLESKSEPELIEHLKQMFDQLGLTCPPLNTLEGILGALGNQSART